jgi:hypothetical protein
MAWLKMLFWRQCGTYECAWWGLTYEDNPFHVHDVVMCKHYATSGTFEFDDDQLVLQQDEYSQKGWDVRNFRRIYFHTHPHESAHPSQTDETNFGKFFANADFGIMSILARGGANYTRMRVRVTNPDGMVIVVQHLLNIFVYAMKGQGKAWLKWDEVPGEIMATLPLEDWLREWEENCRPLAEQPKEQSAYPHYYRHPVYDNNGPASRMGFHNNCNAEWKAVDPEPEDNGKMKYTEISELCTAVIDPDEAVRYKAWTKLVVGMGGNRPLALEWWRWWERRNMIRVKQPKRMPDKKKPPYTDLEQRPNIVVAKPIDMIRLFNTERLVCESVLQKFMWDDVASRYELTHRDLAEVKSKDLMDLALDLLEREADLWATDVLTFIEDDDTALKLADEIKEIQDQNKAIEASAKAKEEKDEDLNDFRGMMGM